MEKELKMKLSLSFFFVKVRQVYAFLFFLRDDKGRKRKKVCTWRSCLDEVLGNES